MATTDLFPNWLFSFVCKLFSHVWLFAVPWTIAIRLLCPWNSPGKNTGVGCHSLSHGIFWTQGLNLVLLSLPSEPPSFLHVFSWLDRSFLLMLYVVVVQSLRQSLSNPMDCSTPRFPVFHHLPELAQAHVHWVSDAIQPFHPLSSPSPPAFNLSQHQGLSQCVGSSHQVDKVLEL